MFLSRFAQCEVSVPQMFDVAIESARRCQVLGGPDASAHFSVCVGPNADASAVDYVHLRPDRVLMDPNDPSTVMLPPSAIPSAPAVSLDDVSLSESRDASPEPVRVSAPGRDGYQRMLERPS